MRTAKIGPDLRLPLGPAPYPPISYFLSEKVPLPYPVPSIDKWYLFQIPSLELCVTFSCCNCIVFKLGKFSRLFHCHKILFVSSLGPFPDRNAQISLPSSSLSYTSTSEILPFHIPEVWKR